VASLIHIFNPQLIVIGGGVADAGEPFLSRIREEAAKKTMLSMYADVKIAASYRGNLSGTIGAGLLVWDT
jgi:glucokinase